jgi:anti-anti-sigma factor
MHPLDETLFHLDVTRDGDAVTMHVRGEFDAHAARTFDQATDRVLRDAPAQVTVDLSEVTFIDSSGLRSLVRVRKHVDAPLVLHGISASTARLLDITGLTDEFVMR